MDEIFETRKVLLSDDEKPEYYEILKGIESNNVLSHKIVLLNDDKTPMSFVSLLFLYFQDIEAREAQKRMMKIHDSGSGELLTTNKPLAERIKIFIASHSSNKGYPLRAEVHSRRYLY